MTGSCGYTGWGGGHFGRTFIIASASLFVTARDRGRFSICHPSASDHRPDGNVLNSIPRVVVAPHNWCVCDTFCSRQRGKSGRKRETARARIPTRPMPLHFSADTHFGRGSINTLCAPRAHSSETKTNRSLRFDDDDNGLLGPMDNFRLSVDGAKECECKRDIHST